MVDCLKRGVWTVCWFKGGLDKKEGVVFLTGLITLVLLMWKWMGPFLRKNYILRYLCWPSLLNWIGALTLSLLLKLPPCLGWCHSCYLELLEKLKKRIYRTAGPSLAASLEPLVHHQNAASLNLPITLVDVLQNQFNWFHIPFLEGGLLVILIDCMIFLSPFLDVTRMSISKVTFLAQLDTWIICL